MNILAVINEEIRLAENLRVYSIPELAQIASQQTTYPVEVMLEMLEDAYQKGGDPVVEKRFEEMVGVQIEALRNGRYVFGALHTPSDYSVKRFIGEVGEAGLETYNWHAIKEIRNEVYIYGFQTEDGYNYEVVIADDNDEEGDWIISFKTHERGYGSTYAGKPFKVMATIVEIIRHFIDGYEQPHFMKFYPFREEGKNDLRRRNLYVAYLKKMLPQRFKVSEHDNEILIMPKEEWDYEDHPDYKEYGWHGFN